MIALKSTQDKRAALQARMEEQRKLGVTIDALVRDADTTQGCGICSLWRRMSRRQRVAAVAAAESVASDPGTAGGVQSSSRLFGIRKSDPHLALTSAASTMESRNQQLESRAASEREEAKRLMNLGQKTSAMRALKRAKATEKQLEANQSALLAVEQQVDLLAQAKMQKELASALATSSKGMKSQKKLLKSAESAVDEAQDARDMAEDLGNVMAEFAQNSGGTDDDELLEELNAMMSEAPAPLPLSSVSEEGVAQSSASSAEIAELEAKIKHLDEARTVRNALPSAPSNSKQKAKEEKAHLLAACSGNQLELT